MKSGGNGSGVAPNIAGLLCYVFAPIISVVFLLIEKENKDVRFHAWQGTLLGCTLFGGHLLLMIFGFILGSIISFFADIFSFFIVILWLGTMVLAIVCMIKAYQGERWKIPVLGDIAANKIGV